MGLREAGSGSRELASYRREAWEHRGARLGDVPVALKFSTGTGVTQMDPQRYRCGAADYVSMFEGKGHGHECCVRRL
jgi:hypothetical protein